MKKELTLCRLSVWAVTAVILGVTLPPAFAQGRSDEALAALDWAQHVPREIPVQFRAGASRAEKAAARRRARGARPETVPEARREDGAGDLELRRIPPGIGIPEAVRQVEGDPAFEFGEPNWVYQHDTFSNDPYYTNGSLWGMYGNGSTPANQYGSQAGEAWASGHTNCSSVYVGVIDPFDPVDGVDNDGNGYTDVVHGWDFDRNDNSTYDGTQDDHGTHAAGTIGAIGGNGKGVAGICWNVQLISAKFIGRAGGMTANAIKAVDYIIDLTDRVNLRATTLGRLAIPAAPVVP